MPTLSNFPYFSQLDNVNSPYGSCNMTSVAMCLAYYGIVGDGSGQLEDQLIEECHNRGLAITWQQSMQEMFKWKGISASFREDASIEDIKRHIDSGNPCIIHGWFTKPSGHIIVIKGYDGQGFIVNDPFGEYHEWGYDTSVSGEGLSYSYSLINRACFDERGAWVHFPKNKSICFCNPYFQEWDGKHDYPNALTARLTFQ